MEINNFEDFLTAAKEQSTPQRLLMLYAKSQAIPTKSEIGQPGGTITPVMCVDKTPQEIPSFVSLKEEADSINKNWDFIFVTTMSGQPGKPPTSEEAAPHLEDMTNDLANGRLKMEKYLIFDRNQDPVIINKM